MTEIGVLPNIRAAQALSDYLKGQGIACQLEPAAEGIIISIVKDQDVKTAEEILDHFLSHPNDPRYLQASWDHGDSRNRIDYGSSAQGIVREFLRDSGPLTLIIFGLCIVIFILMNMGYANQVFGQLSYFGAIGSFGNEASEWWRFFTPSLLHFSLMHISFNLLWWWYFGGKIEKRVGLVTLLTLLIVAGTLPNLLQAHFSGPNFGGLSGVVYALIGYVWVMQQRCPQKGLAMPPALMVMSVLWMILGFAGLLPTATANSAHLGGLLIGLAQGVIDSKRYQ
ncbi:rhomboid family intramembrane serine protease GlpG [Parashewanella curva]|uniref:Rhomboid family intramembrane serine protease GlpG n=1 Tax=Parashewanella curva TaxID=2338552 RepID=A0A3L8PVH8_9GAMM|nr:rhomboid family intramembrane serine protease GlpG [Parashewanella curva]RLV58072.1 rhomboid family intramembrane serine protease GlpG [Parashewanella curva]